MRPRFHLYPMLCVCVEVGWFLIPPQGPRLCLAQAKVRTGRRRRTILMQPTPDGPDSVCKSQIPPHLNWGENVLFCVVNIYQQNLLILIPERMIRTDM